MQSFYHLALAGCPLEKAKQLVEEQINKRTLVLPNSPDHLTSDDIQKARALFLDRRVEKVCLRLIRAKLQLTSSDRSAALQRQLHRFKVRDSE